MHKHHILHNELGFQLPPTYSFSKILYSVMVLGLSGIQPGLLS